MSSGLTVTVDGKQVPLDACGWIQREKCGCIISVLTATAGGNVFATVEQAHKHMVPKARSRAKDEHEGRTWELITMAHYREHIGSTWECADHAKDGAA